MNIRIGETADIRLLSRYDRHISKEELEVSLKLRRVYIAEENGAFIGWLRYNLFWDNTPFMNMLYILDGHRGKGAGKALVLRWEKDMEEKGSKAIMTSTASNEYAQHFYEKLGYEAIGGFIMKGEPYELIMAKSLE